MAYASLFGIALAAGLIGAQMSAQMGASAGARATLTPSGGIAVVNPLILPSIVVSRSQPPQFASTHPAAGTAGGQVASNARLTVRRDNGEAVSLDVPPSFDVVRVGGDEILTVNTLTRGDLSVVGEGVLPDGTLVGESAATVDIGGRLALAASDRLVPGPYSGLFVVVVQYN